MNNSRVPIIGANPSIGMQWQPGILVTPIAVTMQNGGQVQVTAMGGKTILLDVAAQLLASSACKGDEEIETALNAAAKLIDAHDKLLFVKVQNGDAKPTI